jgi:hypothetical protein
MQDTTTKASEILVQISWVFGRCSGGSQMFQLIEHLDFKMLSSERNKNLILHIII